MKPLKHQTTGKVSSIQAKEWGNDKEETVELKEKGKQNAKESNNKSKED